MLYLMFCFDLGLGISCVGFGIYYHRDICIDARRRLFCLNLTLYICTQSIRAAGFKAMRLALVPALFMEEYWQQYCYPFVEFLAIHKLSFRSNDIGLVG